MRNNRNMIKMKYLKWCEEGEPFPRVVLNQHIYPPHISVQCIYGEWDIPINVHRYGI